MQRAKRPPVLEILGPWLENKGDDLMLRSILERLEYGYTLCARRELHEAASAAGFDLERLVWPPTRRALKAKLLSGSIGSRLRFLRGVCALPIAPRAVLRARGWVRSRDISLVLDCSGFAYGDQWETPRTLRRERYARRVGRAGARLIMLPQALGPFQKPEIRARVGRLLERFEIIYARDERSRQHVLSLGLDPERVRSAPDITHLLEGTPPEEDVWAERVCIVPNMRMLDRTADGVGSRYVAMLLDGIQIVRTEGFEPILVLHESNDDSLVQRIRASLDFAVPVVDEDARVTKGILGRCHAVLGSRYHSLVGALSQGTPSVGTSWSHKYDMLFEEYGIDEYVLSPTDSPDRLRERLGAILDPGSNGALRATLSAAAERQKERVRAMWEDVEERIAGPHA